MDKEEADHNGGDEDSDSDSEDEDFLPGNQPKQVVSEEDSDDTGKRRGGKKAPVKRKNDRMSKSSKLGKGVKPKIRRVSRKNQNSSEEEEDDDEDDEDFIPDEKDSTNHSSEEVEEDPKVVLARDRAEKERTDRLWSSFLSDVETSKSKKGSTNQTEDQIVTKVYDFAGERVEVQEKASVDVSKTDRRKAPAVSYGSNGFNGAASSSSSSLNGDKLLYGSGQPAKKPQLPFKTRISFLSGDPADIGLSGDRKMSAKEGLANVLNALQARSKKLGTLEKSKLDWESFKRDQGLQEELQSHNRSKSGYIDKQEFLQRADYRQFELEKEARSKRRKPLI